MSTTMSRTSRSTAIALSIVLTAVAASLVNALLALLGGSLGASGPALQPIAYLSLTVVAAIGGAIGWHLIGRFSKRPGRVIRWLVPAFLVLSFVPDLVVGVSTGTGDGWLYATVLMVMHITTITIAVLTYRRLMPLSDRQAPAATSR